MGLPPPLDLHNITAGHARVNSPKTTLLDEVRPFMRQCHYSIHTKPLAPSSPSGSASKFHSLGKKYRKSNKSPPKPKNIRQIHYAPGLPLEVQPECQPHHQRRKPDANITL